MKPWVKTILVTVAVAAAMLVVALFCNGCVNENTGSSTVVGEQMILPEITDSGDNIGVRVFEDIKGARVWTAKDSKVCIKYVNTWTNNVLGIYDSKGAMALDVEIEPLDCSGEASDDEEPAEEPKTK